jgi:DNA-binding HxlR family transcriptional regulator
MDARTISLIDALRQPGAAFLVELLNGSATEANLLGTVKQITQATANRRLRNLEGVGLIQRAPGNAKAPGRRWTLVHPREIDALMTAAVALSDVLAEQEQVERDEMKRKLKRSRAKRQGLRDVSNGCN